MVKYNIAMVFLLTLFVIVAGCTDAPKTEIGTLPTDTTQNLKEQHDYTVLNLQGNSILYQDGDLIKSLTIDGRGYEFYLGESNRTYLHYERYGGWADFYQWTLYVNRS